MHWATRILVHYFYLLHFHPTLLHIDTLLFCFTVTSSLKLTLYNGEQLISLLTVDQPFRRIVW